MKAFVLVNEGLEELALAEISELSKVEGKKKGRGLVEFSAEKEELVKLCYYGQSLRRVLAGLDSVGDWGKAELAKVKWGDYLFKDCLFRVEVLGVKGNEKRMEICREISKKVFEIVKKELGFELSFDFKIPDVKLVVYFDGVKYFVGVDLGGYELNKRGYRVFVHSASLKGDLGYYLLRKSGFAKGEKLVVGLVKDGVLAIEAGLFVSGKKVNRERFAWEEMPGFKGIEAEEREGKGEKIFGFDVSKRNVTAAKKNARIARVEEELQLVKMEVDELDVRFKEGEVDRLIFLVTKKDEGKINEIYHQAKYVLRKKGILLMVGREGWEVQVGEGFRLRGEEVLKRGGSRWKVWVMERK